MPRFARVIYPEIPYHVIDRGNHQQDVFFSDADRFVYLRLLDEFGAKFGISFQAYCLMTNHVHLVAVPAGIDSFAKGFAEIKRRYTTIINLKYGLKGVLWQGRFRSFPMDEPYRYRAIRYIERNPVRAGIVPFAEDYRWSSASAHVLESRDTSFKLLDWSRPFGIEDWRAYLGQEDDDDFTAQMREHERTGRPLGSEEFLSFLEKQTGRVLIKRIPGRKRKPPMLKSEALELAAIGE